MNDRFVVDPPQLDLRLKQLRLPAMRTLWRTASPSAPTPRGVALGAPARRAGQPGGHRPRAAALVQKLQAARRDLALEAAIHKLHKYHLVILDDFSCVTCEQAETSILFELIGARYENRSLLVIANEPFSAWGKIFASDAMTVAAVDRLVHRSHIFELNVESYRRRGHVWPSSAHQEAETVVLIGPQGGRSTGAETFAPL